MIPLASTADRLIRRWPTSGSRAWVHDFLRHVQYDDNVIAVVAVGSAVRRDVSSEDVDLLVICVRKSQCQFAAPIEVDLRAIQTDEIEKGLREGQDLISWAVKFGEPLYDSAGRWASLLENWRDSIPLPDPAVALERAATAKSYLERMEAVGDENAALDLRVSYLTHLARARLSEAGIYPASRPELADQLGEMGATELAAQLSAALKERSDSAESAA